MTLMPSITGLDLDYCEHLGTDSMKIFNTGVKSTDTRYISYTHRAMKRLL